MSVIDIYHCRHHCPCHPSFVTRRAIAHWAVARCTVTIDLVVFVVHCHHRCHRHHILSPVAPSTVAIVVVAASRRVVTRRFANVVVVVVVAHRAIAIIVDFVARRAVAIVVVVGRCRLCPSP